MIEISCTKQLAESLPVVLAKEDGSTPGLFHWYAKSMKIARRDAIVAVCVESCFGVVLWGLKKKDFQKFPEIMRDSIRTVLTRYGISKSMIERYVSTEENMLMTKAVDRSGIARVNTAAKNLNGVTGEVFSKDSLLQLRVTKWLNRGLVTNQKKDYVYRDDSMLDALGAFYGEPPISGMAFHLRASLDLERYTVIREFTVPATISFPDLHMTLQLLFGWQDYHMHEFIFPADGQEMHILPEEAEPDADDIVESNAYLSELLPLSREFMYIYDFGDSWEIRVKLLGEETKYNKDYPTVTICEGISPPEDVGGVPGFLDFLDALSDPQHPEHEETLEWAGPWRPAVPNPRMLTSTLEMYTRMQSNYLS